MSKEIIKSVILVAFLALPSFVSAQARISEIMYDLEGTDTGREWIEIENTGSNPIDLSMWKVFEASTNHKISPVGAALVPAGGFAVIADVPDKFKADNPSYSGLLFDSAFSLSNDGETLIVRDENGVDIDSVSYQPQWGGAGDGHSIQRLSSGSWTSAVPTPGSAAVAQSDPGSGSNTQSTTTANGQGGVSHVSAESNADAPVRRSAHSSQAVANVSFDEPTLEVTSGRPRLGFVGVPLEFEAKIKSAKNVIAGNVAANKWSMGDGSELSGQFISHAYEYPGSYVVILNSELGGAAAVSKVRVEIVEPKVSIIHAGGDYVEISNLDGRELNVGAWRIETLGRRFIVPKDTIVEPRSSLKIPSSISKIDSPRTYVRIVNPSGAVLGERGVGDRVDEVSITPKAEMSVSLEGLTEDILRERISRALSERNDPQVASVNGLIGKKTVRQASAETSKSDARLVQGKTVRATSTSQTAAVIYTVSDASKRSLWAELKGIFRK